MRPPCRCGHDAVDGDLLGGKMMRWLAVFCVVGLGACVTDAGKTDAALPTTIDSGFDGGSDAGSDGGASAPECCVGGCGSASSAPAFWSGTDWACEQGIKSAAMCGVAHCGDLVCSEAQPSCCLGDCAGREFGARCANGWVCPEGSVSASGCPQGACVPPSCGGPARTCCPSCIAETVAMTQCVNGAWSCPAGWVEERDCPDSGRPFCSGLPSSVDAG